MSGFNKVNVNNIDSCIDIRTLADNVPSLCIPRVFSNITEVRIRKVINDLTMGDIERIDMVSKTTEKGEKKRLFNLNGSVSSFFLQEKEIIILEQIFIYCKTNGYIKDENCILCADGLMIQKVLYKPELLKQLNILIKIKTGFNLNFSRKGMDQDYLKILDKNLNFDLYTPTFTTGLIANYFRIMYSNKFVSK